MKHLFLASTAFLLAGCVSVSVDQTASPDTPQKTPAAQGETLVPVIPMVSKALDRSAPLSRIAVGSCLKQEDDQGVWNTVANANPDLLLFIGDNVYGDIWSKDPAMPELRQAYNTLARSEPFAKVRAKMPVLPIWDDHDYGLNDAGGSFNLKYGTEALFEEAWALDGDDPRRARDGVYHAEIVGPVGQRVQIILLDTRFFRSDLKATDERNAKGKERYVPDPDPAKTMLGQAQYEWLQAELQKPAELRLIVSSIQVIAEGHGWEAWRTLPTDRQRLYDTIDAAGADRVVLISGDRHAGALYRKDDVLDYPLYELTASSLNAPQSVWRAEQNNTYVEPGPYRLGGMEYEVNFGTVDVDWMRREVTLSLRGADGERLQAETIGFTEIE